MWPAPCATDDYGLVSDLWGQQILQYLLIIEYYRHRAESKQILQFCQATQGSVHKHMQWLEYIAAPNVKF